MLSSPSSDFFTRIKNSSRAKREEVVVPASKFCQAIADLMKKYGFILDYTVSGDKKKLLTIKLAYKDKQPKISDIKIISRPGCRIYGRSFSLPWGKSKESLIIISTSTGVISQKEAKKRGLGGEIIAEIN